jgi:hypothetical protein
MELRPAALEGVVAVQNQKFASPRPPALVERRVLVVVRVGQ